MLGVKSEREALGVEQVREVRVSWHSDGRDGGDERGSGWI